LSSSSTLPVCAALWKRSKMEVVNAEDESCNLVTDLRSGSKLSEANVERRSSRRCNNRSSGASGSGVLVLSDIVVDADGGLVMRSVSGTTGIVGSRPCGGVAGGSDVVVGSCGCFGFVPLLGFFPCPFEDFGDVPGSERLPDGPELPSDDIPSEGISRGGEKLSVVGNVWRSWSAASAADDLVCIRH
jgi:hypothetical protein